jgi:hypothetical protein
MKCLPILALFAALSAASSASAQVVVSGSYYEEEKAPSCVAASTNVCQVVFTAVPQNVLVTDVSCYVVIGATTVAEVEIGVADSASGGATRRNAHFPLTQMTTNGSILYYATGFKTNFLFGSGRWPTITIATVGDTTFRVDCKIVGTLQ